MKTITMIMKRTTAFAILLTAFFFATGCNGSSSGTHTVSTEHDQFTETVDGRTVEYQDWTITIDGKSIPIEKDGGETVSICPAARQAQS